MFSHSVDFTRRFSSWCIRAALCFSISALGPGYASSQDLHLAWTESVRLPDGTIIQVQRTEQYGAMSYDGAQSRPGWVSETILIPRKDHGPPIVWRSNWQAVGSEPVKVNAIAIYFEGDNPQIVTSANDASDFVYGCSYTNRHRLFVWNDSTGWQYDPRTRIHTKYVGRGNLLSRDSYEYIADQLKLHVMAIGPDDKPGYLIDTLHEKTTCDVSPSAARYRLEDLLIEKKD
jgi:hypothetical protein